MFGVLQIEMAAFKALGKWLTCSGWTEGLSNPGVVAPGVSDSFLIASHLTKTRRANQISAADTHLLQKQAYSKYTEKTADNDDEVMSIAIEEWKSQMSKRVLHFSSQEWVLKNRCRLYQGRLIWNTLTILGGCQSTFVICVSFQ